MQSIIWCKKKKTKIRNVKKDQKKNFGNNNYTFTIGINDICITCINYY